VPMRATVATNAEDAKRPRLLPPAELRTTKAKILDAAYRRLALEGYAAMSTREIARDAGVNHALINYHFRSKDQLVIAVLDEANRRLLERQKQMYSAPGGFAEKWAEARRFYETDLASGFVRVQAELWAAAMSNAELREKFRPRLRAWKQVVLDSTRAAFAAAATSGLRMPGPLTAEVVATWISQFWLGMEWADMIGGYDDAQMDRDALDAVERLLEQLDARARKSGAVSGKAKAARRSGGPDPGRRLHRRVLGTARER